MKLIKQYKCAECGGRPDIHCGAAMVNGCDKRFCLLDWARHFDMHTAEWDAMTPEERTAAINAHTG